MKPARPLSLLTGVMLLGVMLLGVIAAGARPTASAGNPLWKVPLAELSSTRERPIFSRSRRPPPAPLPPPPVAPVAAVPPPKPPEVEPPALSLVGTIIGTDASIGVFHEAATKTVVRLRIGEDHQGWVLRLVKAGEATLVNGEHAVVLMLPPPGEAPARPPSVTTLPTPVVSNESYVDEQPVAVRAPQRR